MSTEEQFKEAISQRDTALSQLSAVQGELAELKKFVMATLDIDEQDGRYAIYGRGYETLWNAVTQVEHEMKSVRDENTALHQQIAAMRSEDKSSTGWISVHGASDAGDRS